MTNQATTLKIHNMHCASCRTLIRMELEDNGMESKIKSIELTDQAKKLGQVRLVNVSAEDVKLITEIINATGTYSVIS